LFITILSKGFIAVTSSEITRVSLHNALRLKCYCKHGYYLYSYR